MANADVICNCNPRPKSSQLKGLYLDHFEFDSPRPRSMPPKLSRWKIIDQILNKSESLDMAHAKNELTDRHEKYHKNKICA